MNTKETLTQLGLTQSEVAVYMTMIDGKVQVKDIIKTTGMKRPSVYYALNKLENKGLIGRVQAGEYNRWQLSDPNRLNALVESKQKDLETLHKEVSGLVNTISTDSAASLQSQVTFYQGQKAVEGIVFNSLYCKGKEILSIAPNNNFFHQVGADFAEKYVAERQKRGIKTKHLWESVESVPKETLKQYYSSGAEIKVLPPQMQEAFSSTVFIYDDTVMYVSSKLSAYAVVFKSKEHAELLRAIYETVWSIAKGVRK